MSPLLALSRKLLSYLSTSLRSSSAVLPIFCLFIYSSSLFFRPHLQEAGAQPPGLVDMRGCFGVLALLALRGPPRWVLSLAKTPCLSSLRLGVVGQAAPFAMRLWGKLKN